MAAFHRLSRWSEIPGLCDNHKLLGDYVTGVLWAGWARSLHRQLKSSGLAGFLPDRFGQDGFWFDSLEGREPEPASPSDLLGDPLEVG